MDTSAFRYAGEYTGDAPVAFHTHPAAELVFQAEGTCRHVLEDGREFVAAPGAVFAVPAGMPHRQSSLTAVRTVYIVGDTPFAGARLFADRGEPFVRQCFTAVLDAWRGGRPGHRTIISGLHATLLEWLGETPGEPEKNGYVPGPQVRRARAFIDGNFRGEISLERMARDCGLSHSYLTAEFRRAWGETPRQYLLRKRLEMAARMLIDPRHNIKETARQCGFSGTNYFTRCFHAAYRVTPTAYRAAHGDRA